MNVLVSGMELVYIVLAEICIFVLHFNGGWASIWPQAKVNDLGFAY